MLDESVLLPHEQAADFSGAASAAVAQSPADQTRPSSADGRAPVVFDKGTITEIQQRILATALAHLNDRDFGKALPMLMQLAVQGVAEAQYKLGVMHQKGDGVNKDYRTAALWFQKAALKDHPKAQYNLGLLYKDGLGVEVDHRQAIAWWERAAKQGHANAQHNLVIICKKHAEKGDPVSQHKLGRMYFRGVGVPFDRVEAFNLFKQAAEASYPPALYWLGLCYEGGFGVAADEVEAVKCLDKAAEFGIREAATKLKSIPEARKILKTLKSDKSTQGFWKG